MPFRTRRDILPPGQQKLWPLLAPLKDLGYCLYGGTALALRFGHRQSMDFDFFTERALDRKALESRVKAAWNKPLPLSRKASSSLT